MGLVIVVFSSFLIIYSAGWLGALGLVLILGWIIAGWVKFLTHPWTDRLHDHADDKKIKSLDKLKK